uniref:Sterile alpha motif domain containing 5 n=1 Tax=Hucho hucho TaxID=62062 RepID=A0A4W5R407_9TELE
MTTSRPRIVFEWLKTLKLSPGLYVESFVDNGYDDLEGDGVYIPHQRQRIHDAVQRLKAEDESAAGLYFMLEPIPTTPPNNHLDRVGRNVGAYLGTQRNLMLGNRRELVIYPKLKLKIMIRDKVIRDGVNLARPTYPNKVYSGQWPVCLEGHLGLPRRNILVASNIFYILII